MEGFFEFLRIVMHCSCLVALILCIILVSCMLYSAWKDNKGQKKQKKQDCLVIYHVDHDPDYIPLSMIEAIIFDSTFFVLKIGIRGVVEDLRVSNSAMLKIEKVKPEKINIYSYGRKRS